MSTTTTLLPGMEFTVRKTGIRYVIEEGYDDTLLLKEKDTARHYHILQATPMAFYINVKGINGFITEEILLDAIECTP